MLQISAGNRRNPAGQDAAWGRSGWECGNEIEKDVTKEEEYCEDVAGYLNFFE